LVRFMIDARLFGYGGYQADATVPTQSIDAVIGDMAIKFCPLTIAKWLGRRSGAPLSFSGAVGVVGTLIS